MHDFETCVPTTLVPYMGNTTNFRVKNFQYVEKFILYRSNKIVCDNEYGLTLYSYKSQDCTGSGERMHQKNYTWGECTAELLGQWPGLIQPTHHGLN